MAVIGSALPSHSLHVCQMKRVGIRCRSTVFNSVQTVQSSSEKTRTHLSNLEKLLQKEVTPQPVKPVDPATNAGQKRSGSRERRILERLNLSGLLPEGIPGLAAEVSAEMSPHRLARLHNLLSKQPEYSPRNRLGARWREYHGERDWTGLLDPLDENLRREIVRYGEFVQAAYQSFHADPATTEAGINAWRDVELTDKSYRVTKSLYATSSIGLPKWVDDVAPDLGWMTQRSSMVGYVAVCHDEKEIARMGRRDIVIALRGTSTCLEWAENMRESLVPMYNNISSENSSLDSQQAKVECGFNSLFRTKGEHVPSLAESVVHEIRRLMELYKGETLSISVTGHSLGAALSLLVGNEINTCVTNAPPVAVFSFGSPRVGNRPFANLINSNNVKVLRIVNNQDVITRVPGMFFNEETEQTLKNNVQWLDTMPWAYSHVGTELRVDTKMSPYLRPDADVACCHDLEAYLHLVDGFMATNCPFRPNAKRSLLKLLSEQGANVKKLYRSKCKAKSLTLKIEGDGIVSLSNNLLTPSVQRE